MIQDYLAASLRKSPIESGGTVKVMTLCMSKVVHA